MFGLVYMELTVRTMLLVLFRLSDLLPDDSLLSLAEDSLGLPFALNFSQV